MGKFLGKLGLQPIIDAINGLTNKLNDLWTDNRTYLVNYNTYVLDPNGGMIKMLLESYEDVTIGTPIPPFSDGVPKVPEGYVFVNWSVRPGSILTPWASGHPHILEICPIMLKISDIVDEISADEVNGMLGNPAGGTYSPTIKWVDKLTDEVIKEIPIPEGVIFPNIPQELYPTKKSNVSGQYEYSWDAPEVDENGNITIYGMSTLINMKL